MAQVLEGAAWSGERSPWPPARQVCLPSGVRNLLAISPIEGMCVREVAMPRSCDFEVGLHCCSWLYAQPVEVGEHGVGAGAAAASGGAQFLGKAFRQFPAAAANCWGLPCSSTVAASS